MTLAKICGLKTLAEVEVVLAAGAQAVGFVHYPPSPRHLELEQVADLVRRLPPFVTSVGLLVSPNVELIKKLHATGVAIIQIHGDGGEHCERLGLSYIQAVAMRAPEDFEQAQRQHPEAKALLLDSYQPSLAGGSGRSFDFSLVPSHSAKPLILAGGLNAANVGAAIRQTQPYAVDVSSGVESTRGVKSPDKIREFMRAVRAANA